MRRTIPILLVDGKTLRPVSATLVEGVTMAEMTAVDAQWSPFLKQATADALARGVPRYDLPEHKHWEWERKARAMNADSVAFAIEADNATQALMIVRTDKTCRLPEQLGERLVYVDYLATAPWNLPELAQVPRLRKSGTRLLEAAVRYSEEKGLDGRVGLHALQQAEVFYRDRFQMQDLEPLTEMPLQSLPADHSVL